VFVTENVAIVRGELLVVLAESLANWQLTKKTYGGPPTLASVMNRWADKVRRVLVHGGIGKLMVVPEFQSAGPVAYKTARKSGEPFEHAIAFPFAFLFVLELEFVIDVQRPNEPIFEPVLLQKNFPFQLRFLIANRWLEIKRETNWILVRTQEPINGFERDRLEMVTVEWRCGIAPRMDVLSTGSKTPGKSFFGCVGSATGMSSFAWT
jgi:hypothetical protein